MHKYWDPHIFQGSHLVSTLKHAREPCEHISPTQMFFHTYAPSLCILGHFLEKNFDSTTYEVKMSYY